MQVIAQQGDTLDLICVRYYGRSRGVLEAVLIANPGLADAGPILAHGTVIDLPEVKSTTVQESVNLWG